MVKANGSEKGFFVYLGPSILPIIQHASIYRGTREQVEEQLRYAIDAYPRIKRLLISGETVSTDRIKVKTQGNYLYNEYRNLISDIKAKKGGKTNGC